jgi:hypothetical protein
MRSPALGPVLLVVLAVAVLSVSFAPAFLPGARAASTNTLPFSGSVTGPAAVGQGLAATFTVTAHGGPAEGLDGSQVGVYSYTASISAANTTGAQVTPVSGVLINFTIGLTLNAPNVTEPLTIYVLVKSTFNSANVSQHFSYTVQIVQPYRLSAHLVVGPSPPVSPFYLTVLLDHQPVGTIVVHGLAAGQSYPITFAYVPTSIAPGWHTFQLSLAQEHGLVAFAGGEQLLSVSFFVAGGGPDYTPWYLAGIAVFVGAIFIWSTTVGGRRRSRPKK